MDSGLKRCGWDTLVGFNTHAYRKRFPIVANVAQEDLRKRGIDVDELRIYAYEKGIYISWSIELPDD